MREGDRCGMDNGMNYLSLFQNDCDGRGETNDNTSREELLAPLDILAGNLLRRHF